MKCLICNQTVKNFRSLQKHVFYQHNLKSKEYYDNYLKLKHEGFCLICNKVTNYININQGYHDYCSIKCQSKDHSIIKKRVSKTSGKNHWMSKNNGNPNRGKKYEEIHGVEKANLLKKKLSDIFHNNFCGDKNSFFGKHHTSETRFLLSLKRKGKTYEEIFGLEKAKYLRDVKKKEPSCSFQDADQYNFRFYDLNLRKKILKEQYDFCPICFCKLEKRKNLHHINYVKKDNRRRNLIYLCIPCHATTNGNRDFWKAYLKTINREILKNEKFSRRLVLQVERNLSIDNRQNILSRRIR